MDKKIYFIGGGRVTKIILQALKNKNFNLSLVTVTDINQKNLEALQSNYPGIKVNTELPGSIKEADIVIIALHPPAIAETLESIKSLISRQQVIISLAPKITIEKIASKLEGVDNIVRLIPNATSYINEGYNPVCFSNSFTSQGKESIMKILRLLGHTFETEESKLEAYAIVSAMLPTYFWFQWYKMIEISKDLGLSKEESIETVKESLIAAVNTLFNSNLSKESVLDLIPVKPIADNEKEIEECLDTKLKGLFNKIKAG